jgi:hypothetical protein
MISKAKRKDLAHKNLKKFLDDDEQSKKKRFGRRKF